MVTILSLALIAAVIVAFISRTRLVQAKRDIGSLNCIVLGLQSDLFYERNKRREYVSEIKEIMMDNRMRRIAEGKRKPTEEDIEWAKNHRPPATRLVYEDGVKARGIRDFRKTSDDDTALYTMLTTAAVMSSYDSESSSADSCSSGDSGGGGGCD